MLLIFSSILMKIGWNVQQMQQRRALQKTSKSNFRRDFKNTLKDALSECHKFNKLAQHYAMNAVGVWDISIVTMYAWRACGLVFRYMPSITKLPPPTTISRVLATFLLYHLL